MTAAATYDKHHCLELMADVTTVPDVDALTRSQPWMLTKIISPEIWGVAPSSKKRKRGEDAEDDTPPVTKICLEGNKPRLSKPVGDIAAKRQRM